MSVPKSQSANDYMSSKGIKFIDNIGPRTSPSDVNVNNQKVVLSPAIVAAQNNNNTPDAAR